MKEDYISTKEIIAKVYRDTGEEIIAWPDLVTWTFELLHLIGHPLQFRRKIAGDKSNPALDITNFKAKLPCNIYKIEQIAVNGMPAYRSSGTFHHLIDGKCCTVGQTGFAEDIFTDNFRHITIDGNTITGPNSFSNNPVSGSDRHDDIFPVTYDVNDSYLTLSVQTGKVCIAYLAFPMDEEGFPLIPDIQQYKEALAAHMISRLDYISWRRGTLPDKVYQEAKSNAEYWLGAAVCKIGYPDVDKMQSMMNQMLRLKPNVNGYESFFTNLSSREHKRIQR